MFLDDTLKRIIQRFEDEFPDTREAAASSSTDSAIAMSADDASDVSAKDKLVGAGSLSSSFADVEESASLMMMSIPLPLSEDEELELAVRPAASSLLVRSNSSLSLSSKALANEEGRVLRAGHLFRTGIVKPEHYEVLSGVEMVGADPKHVRLLHEILEELDDEPLKREVEKLGVVKVFQNHKEEILERMSKVDPVHWAKFVESQEMARANLKVGGGGGCPKGEEAKCERDGDALALGGGGS